MTDGREVYCRLTRHPELQRRLSQAIHPFKVSNVVHAGTSAQAMAEVAVEAVEDQINESEVTSR